MYYGGLKAYLRNIRHSPIKRSTEVMKYSSIVDIARGSHKISHVIKSHEIKNVTDFNVADSVRRDIKVLATKTRYTVVEIDLCLSEAVASLLSISCYIATMSNYHGCTKQYPSGEIH